MALSAFHPFPRLPVELQLMVWELYLETAPVLRHCFVSAANDRPWYYAFDEATRLYVDSRTAERKSVVPGKTIVELPKIHLRDISLPPFSEGDHEDFLLHTLPSLPPSDPRECYAQSNVRISVNLVKEIFYLDCDTLDSFIDPPAEWWDVQSTGKSWLFSIRKLAIDTWCKNFGYWRFSDHERLARFEQLSDVYLVVDHVPGRIDHTRYRLAEYSRRGISLEADREFVTPDHLGLMPLSEFRKLSQWRVEVCPEVDEFQGNLEAVFQKNNLNVRVQRMVDIF
ncbi:hypothetical protein F5Y17DRAFT_449168 [Xylariaceae sp. FL0594]|nr:hypothetical protein F5Y17DRAFT_449168 [Xylariaceae sp. FL0594]